jgi:hypothetical protein
MLENLIIGGSAAVIARTLTSPLEIYKIQAQNRYLKESTIKNIIKKEGIRYLWKGNGVNSIRAFPQFAANFASFEWSKNNLFHNLEDPTMKNFLSGGVAGLAAMTAIYPLETIRIRLSLQMCKSHYKTPIDVIKKLSLREIYGGLSVSLVGYSSFSACNFMFYDEYKNFFNKYDTAPLVNKLLSGGFSGITALSITYPTEIIRRRLQMQGFSSEVPKYNGILDCLSKMYKTGGMREFYKGLIPAYVRTFPCLAIQFWCLEKGKQLFSNNT